MTRRVDRVNANLRQQISEILANEVKNPRIDGMISVVDVETTSDLRRAKVFVSVYGSDDARKVLKALKSASGFVGRRLSNRLAMRTVPQIQFRLDDSIERGSDLSAKILQATGDLPSIESVTVESDPVQPAVTETGPVESMSAKPPKA
jgi:ribosome-binding factor A